MNRSKVNRYNQRERDKFMPGWEEFMRLSRGIMEDEDDQAEETDVELLAEPPPSYNPFPDELEDDERDQLEEKRKEKEEQGESSAGAHGRWCPGNLLSRLEKSIAISQTAKDIVRILKPLDAGQRELLLLDFAEQALDTRLQEEECSPCFLSTLEACFVDN